MMFNVQFITSICNLVLFSTFLIYEREDSPIPKRARSTIGTVCLYSTFIIWVWSATVHRCAQIKLQLLFLGENLGHDIWQQDLRRKPIVQKQKIRKLSVQNSQDCHRKHYKCLVASLWGMVWRNNQHNSFCTQKWRASAFDNELCKKHSSDCGNSHNLNY